MFVHTADLYDVIYSFKDYELEAHRTHALIRQDKTAVGMVDFDLAQHCGALICVSTMGHSSSMMTTAKRFAPLDFRRRRVRRD